MLVVRRAPISQWLPYMYVCSACWKKFPNIVMVIIYPNYGHTQGPRSRFLSGGAKLDEIFFFGGGGGGGECLGSFI